jgi:hypothetical protein
MGRKARLCRWVPLGACCVLAALVAVPMAGAHQTSQNKGVSVTLHVTPDDEPVAGEPSKIIVTKVKPRSGRFSWRTCVCYLNIKDASGHVVLNRRAVKRMTFTFSRAGAYQLTFAGFIKRRGKKVHFSVPFAIRAG